MGIGAGSGGSDGADGGEGAAPPADSRSWRASQIRSSVHFKLISRETGLLLNNVILVVTACSILLGTLYPLVLDALGVGKISVGPPYFNSVFIPLTAPLAALVGGSL